MTSNLGCIGLNTDADGFMPLLHRAFDSSEVVAQRPGMTVCRWQDATGARVVFAIDGNNEVISATPSLAGEPGAFLGDLSYVDDGVWIADVLDDQGVQATRAAVELEDSAFFDPDNPPAGPAIIVAFGVNVALFADAEEFTASPASILNGETDEAPPPEYVENGWSWPPRWAPESFISYGAFDADNGAHAMLNGTVLTARTAQNSLTGQEYHVARVRTAGFEAELCLAASDHQLPTAGQLVSGTVYLIAGINPR